jgi:hypothetical protein
MDRLPDDNGKALFMTRRLLGRTVMGDDVDALDTEPWDVVEALDEALDIQEPAREGALDAVAPPGIGEALEVAGPAKGLRSRAFIRASIVIRQQRNSKQIGHNREEELVGDLVLKHASFFLKF